MNKRTIAAIIALLLIPLTAFAQLKDAAKQKLVLEYVDGDALKVVDAKGIEAAYGSGILEGDSIAVGSTVMTGSGTAIELKITPNGTIIKVAANTSFRVDSLASSSKETNAFALIAGKVRAVAAKGAKYEIRSKTTVCGVRGTDFSYDFQDGVKNTLMVGEGLVDFAKLQADGTAGAAIKVAAGQFADFYAAAFGAAAYTQDQYNKEFGDVQFKKLDPKSVSPAGADAGAATPPAETASDEGDATGASAQDPFMKWLGQMLGLEIGSLTIDGVTYSKAIIQPKFEIGKLKVALYLPIVYTSNMFDPDDWYHPKGNDEWSFGYDYGWNKRPLKAAGDAVRDIALKFRYVQFGQPLDDPFFFKLGNLNNFTIGHGLVMRNYANDTEFPAVRRLGINVGYDFGPGGFEAMVSDATDPQIFGGRAYFRPMVDVSKFAIGLSGVVDWSPSRPLVTTTSPDGDKDVGDPAFIAAAVDMDLPIIERNPVFGFRLFADGGLMLPYARTDANGNIDKTGLQWNMVFDKAENKVKNWGAVAGAMGNVLFIDWRLEYRYFTGAFRAPFFDSTYDRNRGTLAQTWYGYMSGDTPISDAPNVMGVYGEGVGNLFGDKIAITLGYFWPWSLDAGLDAAKQMQVATNDYFVAKLTVNKGLIPVLDLYGGISYERRNLIRTLVDGKGSSGDLFDENTVFKGELVMPVPNAPGLDLAFVFATAVQRDADGNVMYKTLVPEPVPEIIPVISLETRIHF